MVSLSADKSKLMFTYELGKAGVVVLATEDLSVLTAKLMSNPSSSQLVMTISNGIDKWYSFGGMKDTNCLSNDCLWVVMTMQDSHEIFYRYYRHSS